MTPDVQILQLVEGAKNATGLTVIIDVCRAFSTAAFLASQGVAEIFPVGTIERAFQLHESLPGSLLVGEVKGRKPDGFDLGNSPAEILQTKVTGQTAIQRTSAGTQGIVNAKGADEILTGAFVNAEAIVRYIKNAKPRTVSFVCMGWEAEREAEEDTLCAEYLRAKITGQEFSFSEIVERVQLSETGDKFRNPEYFWMPEEDLKLCLSLDLFAFVLRCDPKSDLPRLQRIDV